MAIYEYRNDSLMLEELHIYGSQRLGIIKENRLLAKYVNIFPPSSTFKTSMPNTPLIPYPYTLTPYHFGKKHYELSDWLGNVRVVINDKKTPQGTNPSDMTYAAQVLEVNDYYPFGSLVLNRSYDITDYRYGFGKHEKDNEISGEGNHLSFGDYGYSTRLGRRWNVDPVIKEHEASYAVFANNPVWFMDPNGRDTVDINKDDKGKWNVSKTQIAKGDDVFRVKIGDQTKTYTFSEGEYGKRINYLRLEDKENETFGIFHLSGTDATGYIVEPEGPDTKESGKNKRIPIGSYNLKYSNPDPKLVKWPGYPLIYNNNVSAGRGILLHWGENRKWSEGCLIVSCDYSLDKQGRTTFSITKSEEMIKIIGTYLGAAKYDPNVLNKAGKRRGKFIYESFDRINSAKLNIQQAW